MHKTLREGSGIVSVWHPQLYNHNHAADSLVHHTVVNSDVRPGPLQNNLRHAPCAISVL